MLFTAIGSIALSTNQCVTDNPAAAINSGTVNVFNLGKYSFIVKYCDEYKATRPAVAQSMVVVTPEFLNKVS
mgnify:CR=1 FL=1